MDFASILSFKILPACGEGDRAQRGGGGFGLAAGVASLPKFASGLTPPPTRLRYAPAGHLPMNGEDL
jgi:hypothetical protein